MDQDYSFDAFISYRRSDGTRAARKLRHELVTFKLPKSLEKIGRPGPLRIYLDTIYERATEDFFQKEIAPALKKSRNFILVRTPDSLLPRNDGQENWMVREIREFSLLPQRDNISVALAKGELHEDLPDNLHIKYPQAERVDIRTRSQFRKRIPENQLLKFIATLHDIPPERMPELKREMERRRFKNLRAWLSAIVVLFAILSFLTGVALIKAAAARRELRTATSLRIAAEAQNQLPRRIDLGLLLADKAIETEPTANARASMLAAFNAGPRIRKMFIRESPITASAMSSDGMTLAIAYGDVFEVFNINRSIIPNSTRKLGVKRIDYLALSRDGRFLAITADGDLRLFDFPRSTEITCPSGSPVKQIGFSPTEMSLGVLHSDGKLVFYKVDQAAGLQEESISSDGLGETERFAFSPDGTRVATQKNGHLRFLDISSAAIEESDIRCNGDFAWVDNDTIWADGGDNQTSLSILRLIHSKNTYHAMIDEVSTTRALGWKGPIAAYAGITVHVNDQYKITIRQPTSRQTMQDTDQYSIGGHTHNVYQLSFGGKDTQPFLISIGEVMPGNSDSSRSPTVGAILWDLRQRSPLETLYGQVPNLSSHGSRLLALGEDLVIGDEGDGYSSQRNIAWRQGGSNEWKTQELTVKAPSVLAASADGKRIACGDRDGTIFLMEVEKPMRALRRHSSNIIALAFDSDGLLIFGGDGRLVRRSGTDDKETIIFQTREPSKNAVIGATGTWLAYETREGSAIVNLRQARSAPALLPGLQSINRQTTRIIDTAREPEFLILSGQGFSIVGLKGSSRYIPNPIVDEKNGLPQDVSWSAINQDGSIVALGSRHYPGFSLWEPTTWKLIGTVRNIDTQDGIFDAKTGALLTLSSTFELSRWEVSPAHWQTLAREIAGRSLTSEEQRAFVDTEASR